MKTINITASGLAKLTGHNKYETLEKTVNGILNSNHIKQCDVSKSYIEEKLKKLDAVEINKIKIELGVPKTSTITEIEQIIKKSIMVPSYDKGINENQSKKLIDEKVKNKEGMGLLEDSIKKDLMMRRGTIKENQNLDHIQNKNNIQIGSRNLKMYSKVLFTDPDNKYEVILRGKVDGISEDHIIETKNRTKCLFNTLRNYEQVQIEAYMFLTDLQKSILTEHYDGESNEINYEHDEDFWCQCIKNTQLFIETHIKPHIL